MHYLMETAMAASKDYKVLPLDEVEAMWKELDALSSRIDATQHKLALEIKVRDAAQSAGRLPGGHAPDTQADEAAQSARKCDELGRQLRELEGRQQFLQKSLLEHTAGVLQATHKGYLKNEPDTKNANMNGFSDDFGDASQYRPYTNFVETGLGFGEGAPNAEFAQQNQMVLDVERRVEELNGRLREMILEYKPDKRDLPHPARELQDDPENPGDILLDQVDFLEQCLDSLDHLQKSKGLDAETVRQVTAQKHEEHSQFIVDTERRVEDLNMQIRSMILDMKPAKEDLPNPQRELRDDPNNPKDILEGQMEFLEQCIETIHRLRERDRSVQSDDAATEERLESLNTQLFQMMTTANPEKASKYTPPPEALGQSLPDQLDYLEGGLGAVDRRLKELNDEADNASDELANYQDRAEKYATVVGGLWDTLSVPDEKNPGSPTVNENFSLQAFSKLVQDLHRKHAMLEDQKVVLTRQIQQQRELNATADTAKDTKLTDARDLLEKAKAELAQTQREATAHAEKLGVAHAELDAVRSSLALRDDQQQRSDAKALAELESEVVRLRTELTMTKAELDGAHGTRAQRAAEAAGETPELRARIATLQQELADTIGDYEAMTRASIEFEKERETLENVADGLRDRVERLEAQLAEERIQTLGGAGKSPTPGEKAAGGSGTGAGVLKAEFRKMMRETRVEHSKALRVRLTLLRLPPSSLYGAYW